MTQLSKWQLLRAVEGARQPLSLKATSLNILRTMISLVPGDALGAAPDQHICFASNATLAGRAHVSEKTVERHISYLVELGLIKRASAMNGKRWARRDGQGRVVVASGLSLAPLLQRHAEFKELAEAQSALMERLNQLRAQCRVLLGQIQQIPALIEHAQKLLRRNAVNEATLSDLLKELTANLRDSAPEIEGHKEPNNIPEVNQSEIETAFPRLCSEIRTARNTAECQDRMDEIARELCLGNAWSSARRKGASVAFFIMGYILQRIERISNPRAYLASLNAKLEAGAMTWKDLVNPKHPQPQTIEV